MERSGDDCTQQDGILDHADPLNATGKKALRRLRCIEEATSPIVRITLPERSVANAIDQTRAVLSRSNQPGERIEIVEHKPIYDVTEAEPMPGVRSA